MNDAKTSDLPKPASGAAADAVIVADAQGIISMWNDSAEHLFGFSSADAVGSSLDLIVPADLRAAHWRGFEHAMKRGRVVRGGTPTLTRATHKTEGSVYVTLAFSLIVDDSEAVTGAVATVRRVPNPHEPARAV